MSRIRLAEGAGGKVYLEREVIDGQTFYKAVKEIGNSYRNEVRLMDFLKSLTRPNVIHIRDGKDDHEIEMDLIPGGCLTDFFGRNVEGFDARCKLRIAYQVADALRELHQAKFLHRDVKPDNVLIDENFNAVLTDLGFGRSFPLGERPTYVPGTYVYSPPEVQSEIEFDEFLRAHGMEEGANEDQLHQLEAIDVYQFGMFLYAIFAERVPFEEYLPNKEDIKKHIQDGARPDWPVWTDSAAYEGVNIGFLEGLYHCCTAPQAKDRPSMEEVIEQLRLAFTDKAVLGECNRWLDTPIEQQPRHGTPENVEACVDRGFPGAADISSRISEMERGRFD